MGPDGKTVEEARGGRGALWRSFAADERLVTGEVDADCWKSEIFGRSGDRVVRLPCPRVSE